MYNYKSITMILLCNILIIFVIFSLYVQFSPTMGNIWLRHNHENNLIFCPMNLVRLIFRPFIDGYFWRYEFLAINFWVYLVGYLIIVYNLIIGYDNN